MKTVQNLIINADDFGLSAEVNAGIRKAIESGSLNSVSLMVNLPYFDEAVGFLRSHPEISVGLHLNISEGRSVLPPSQVSGLLREDNNFFYWPSIVARLIFRQVKLLEIQNEFQAQFEKLSATGIKITHIDSHHHLHLFPPIFKFVTHFADERGIRSLRCHHYGSWSLTAGIGKRPTLKQLFLILLLWLDSAVYDHPHRYEIDCLYDLNWSKNLSESDLLQIFENLPDGTTELICHLGVVSDLGNRRFLEPRLKILNLLTQDLVRERIVNNGINLVRRGANIILTEQSDPRVSLNP